MEKKLTAIGNSLGVIIERPILDLLNIDRDTVLEITTDGVGLFITPRRQVPASAIESSANRLSEIHRDTLKKLAE